MQETVADLKVLLVAFVVSEFGSMTCMFYLTRRLHFGREVRARDDDSVHDGTRLFGGAVDRWDSVVHNSVPVIQPRAGACRGRGTRFLELEKPLLSQSL